jgi:epoxyqueuosine reductase QueG
MKEKIKSFFEKENIEFYAVVPFSSLKVTNEGIMSRSGIAPQSAIIFLLPYYSGETENLSRYAASLDYHIIIKDVTERLIKLLSKEYPEKMHRGYGDHSPIDERGAAAISGLGIIGDNGLLINEKYGSYVFVAEVLSEIEADVLGKSEISAPKFCHHCGICKKMCPTEILSGKSNLCLSEITQRKGELSDFEIELMRKVNTVWGCDECQRACPHNANPIETPIEFFHKKRISKLTGEILANMSDEEFSERAFAWRKRKTVERNLEYVEK